MTRFSFSKGLGCWDLCLAAPSSLLDETLVGDAWRLWLHSHRWSAPSPPRAAEGEAELVLRLAPPPATSGPSDAAPAAEWVGLSRAPAAILYEPCAGPAALDPLSSPLSLEEQQPALRNMTPVCRMATLYSPAPAAPLLHAEPQPPQAACVIVEVPAAGAADWAAVAAPALARLQPQGLLVIVLPRGSSAPLLPPPKPPGRSDLTVVAVISTPTLTRLLAETAAAAGQGTHPCLSATLTRQHARLIHGRVYVRAEESAAAKRDGCSPLDAEAMLARIRDSSQAFREAGVPAVDALCLRLLALRTAARHTLPLQQQQQPAPPPALFPAPLSGATVLASLTEYRDACAHSWAASMLAHASAQAGFEAAWRGVEPLAASLGVAQEHLLAGLSSRNALDELQARRPQRRLLPLQLLSMRSPPRPPRAVPCCAPRRVRGLASALCRRGAA